MAGAKVWEVAGGERIVQLGEELVGPRLVEAVGHGLVERGLGRIVDCLGDGGVVLAVCGRDLLQRVAVAERLQQGGRRHPQRLRGGAHEVPADERVGPAARTEERVTKEAAGVTGRGADLRLQSGRPIRGQVAGGDRRVDGGDGGSLRGGKQRVDRYAQLVGERLRPGVTVGALVREVGGRSAGR